MTTTSTVGERPRCFVVIPMGANVDGYSQGHFSRVYEELISPACGRAGFQPIFAGTNTATELIMADVLRQLVEAEMVVCDISSRNPNVFFELGLRQAFDKPVAIVKDDLTPRPFDIAGLRDTEYRRALRVDEVRVDIESIASIVKETYAKHRSGADTLMKLINMQTAAIPSKVEASPETQAILQALGDISRRLSTLETRASASYMPYFDPAYNSSAFMPKTLGEIMNESGVNYGLLGRPTQTIVIPDPTKPKAK